MADVSEKTDRSFMLPMLVLTVVTGSFLPTGYTTTIVNVPKPILRDFINRTAIENYGVNFSKESMSVVWSLTIAFQGLGAVIGSIFAKIPLEKIGRKWSVFGIVNGSYILGSVLMLISKACESFVLIMVGRFISGIGTGFTLSVVSVYSLECSPVKYRGLVGSCGFLALLVGSALAFLIGSFTSENNWPYSLGATIVPALLTLLLSPLFPESPKYLLLCKKDETAAVKSIGFYFGKSRVTATIAGIRKEEQSVAGVDQIGLVEVMKHRQYRTPFMVSMVGNVAPPAAGLFAIFSYSSTIFNGLGLSKEHSQIVFYIMIGVNIVSGVVQVILVYKVRRRTLMLGSLIVIVIAHIVYFACALGVRYGEIQWLSFISAGAFVTVLLAINLGIASTSIFLPAEITTVAFRAITATSGSVVRCAGILITQFAFDPMYVALGDYTFLFFIFTTSLCLIYLWMELPETKGRTLDQITSKWLTSTTEPDEPLLSIRDHGEMPGPINGDKLIQTQADEGSHK